MGELKVPKALRPVVEEIVGITNSVCVALLYEEYADLARRGALLPTAARRAAVGSQMWTWRFPGMSFATRRALRVKALWWAGPSCWLA